VVANAQALESGLDEVVCQLDGRDCRQAPLGYEGKWLRWLRADYEALGADDRLRVDAVLSGTGWSSGSGSERGCP
jgi:hypothetical protein